MVTASFAERVGSAVKTAAMSKQSTWHTPLMASASRAITDRIPLVDVVLDVRDARIPLSSECGLLKSFSALRRIIVLNKMDLVERSHLKEWISYFEGQNYAAYGINSHNKDATQEFLNFLRGQVRALSKIVNEGRTVTIMLVGNPNVGKSALANALHQVGRISAAEKGKLRYAVVSPLPAETTTISSLKVASHPNIYVLDTPGVLPPQIADAKVCAKLALTGTFRDCLAGEKDLVRYFLAIFNCSDQYKKWERQFETERKSFALENEAGLFCRNCDLGTAQMKGHPTDHTQDSIVRDVRRHLFNAITSFEGHLQNEEDMVQLVEMEMEALRDIFCLPRASTEDDNNIVAVKLLNLYRTGRLGKYTLNVIPDHV